MKSSRNWTRYFSVLKSVSFYVSGLLGSYLPIHQVPLTTNTFSG